MHHGCDELAGFKTIAAIGPDGFFETLLPGLIYFWGCKGFHCIPSYRKKLFG
jgi:hypothetical protein